MENMINDWEYVVRSLIGFLEKDGIEAYAAHNGEDDKWTLTMSRTKLADKVCECDEGHLKVSKGEMVIQLYIVLGNSPSEIVSDYSYESGTDCDPFEKSWHKFCAYWEKRGDAVPKKLSPYVKN